MLCAKFGWNWHSGSGEEDENAKSLRQRRWQPQRTTNKFFIIIWNKNIGYICFCLCRCAPEVIQQTKYSSKTDVWSFGVVLWECFSQGQIPNLSKVTEELRKITYYLLEKGVRLQRPQDCDEEVYGLMMKCWEWEASKRPPFSQIFVQCLWVSIQCTNPAVSKIISVYC